MPARPLSKSRTTKPLQHDKSEITRLIVSALALCKIKRETNAADHLLEALRALHPDQTGRKERI